MVCSDGVLAPVRRLAWQALAAGALWIAFAGHAATTPAVPAPPPRFDWSGPADAMAAAALGPLRGAAEVGVWHDGQTRFGAARNRVAESPIQALFEVGSISKVFTGLLLAQAGQIGLGYVDRAERDGVVHFDGSAEDGHSFAGRSVVDF